MKHVTYASYIYSRENVTKYVKNVSYIFSGLGWSKVILRKTQ